MNTVDFIHRCPYCSVPEYEALKALASTFENNSTIVMIGAGPGELLMSFLEGFKHYDCKSFVVDIETCQYALAHIQGNSAIPSNLKNVCYIVESSENFSNTWKGDIDLLIVDGDHTKDAVETDIKCWLPHVVEDGYVWFHDYDFEWDPNVGLTKFDTGVKEAVDNLLETYDLQPILQVGCSLLCRKQRL